MGDGRGGSCVTTIRLCLLGHELLRLDVDALDAPVENHADLTAVNRHSGDFGFAGSPARPYWSHDPQESPPVAATIARSDHDVRRPGP